VGFGVGLASQGFTPIAEIQVRGTGLGRGLQDGGISRGRCADEWGLSIGLTPCATGGVHTGQSGSVISKPTVHMQATYHSAAC
jgi:pyruvate/2-oxoglutarate/acetoin dehydrogenase E1 component